MNGKQAKRLRRAVGTPESHTAKRTYEASRVPSGAYFVQSFDIVGAVNWVTVYRRIPKLQIETTSETRHAYKQAKRDYLA